MTAPACRIHSPRAAASETKNSPTRPTRKIPKQSVSVGICPSRVEAAIAIAVSTTIPSNTITRPIMSWPLKSVRGSCNSQNRLTQATSPTATVTAAAPSTANVAGKEDR